MLVLYKDKAKGPKYQPDLQKDEYWVTIVIKPEAGLPLFSKGSQTGKVTKAYQALSPLVKGSIVIFNGRLYREDVEVKGEGCMAIVFSYS